MNIEELARRAGFVMVSTQLMHRSGPDANGNEFFSPLTMWHISQVARLVAEECAKVCEAQVDLDDDTCDEAERCAAAIREAFK